MDFKTMIRAELGRQGISQSELGRRAKMTRARVSTFLNGKRDVQSETLQRMFLALGIQVTPADKPGNNMKGNYRE